MSHFDTFTKRQKDTHALVHDLEHQLMKSIDPSTFVLNPETEALRARIIEAQEQCDHIWENGVCIVCNKEEPKA